jgi:peptidyl-prolyl cis-trans isomerase SurA
MKKLAVSVFFCLLLVPAWTQRKVVDKVIAQVGGELVLLSELEEQHTLFESQRGVTPPDARCFILDQILAQKLLINQAKLDSVEIGDEEVDAQLDARIDRILGLMGNDIAQFEAYYGQSIGQVKEQFREDLKNQILADRMRNKVMSGITASPSEVRAFFNQIPKDSLPYFNSEVELNEIVVVPKTNEVEKNKARQKLESLRKRIVEEGEDFAAIAGKYSDDLGSARTGGDLGWTKRGKFVPEFEAAAYNLEPGEISAAVESEYGFHLIQLLERRGNTIHTRHLLVKPQIVEQDLAQARHLLDSVRQLVVTDSLSFSLAVKKFSDKNTQSTTNDGRMVNPATGNTIFETGDLDPDVFFTIDTMQVGSVSAPFEFSQPTGEKAYRILKLVSRTSPHKANLRQDFSKIQTATIESKKNNFINQWITEKVDATYIEIDPAYHSCSTITKWQSVSKQ